MRPDGRLLPDRVLDRVAEGHNVPDGATLRSLFASVAGTDGTVLVVFLRHYG